MVPMDPQDVDLRFYRGGIGRFPERQLLVQYFGKDQGVAAYTFRDEREDAATRQVFLDAVAHGSVISWQHIIHWPAKHCTATTVNRPPGFSGLDLSAVRQ